MASASIIQDERMGAWPIAFADVLAARAGAAGLAAVLKLRETLSGRAVGIVLSGANIDQPTLRRVLNGEI